MHAINCHFVDYVVSFQKEMSSSQRNFFLSKDIFFVKGNCFMSKEIISCKRNWCPWKEVISCERNWFPVKVNDFLWKEMNSCERTHGYWRILLQKNLKFLRMFFWYKQRVCSLSIKILTEEIIKFLEFISIIELKLIIHKLATTWE